MTSRLLKQALLVAAATLSATAQATTTRTCSSYKIPITASSANLVWALPPFSNNFEVASFVDAIASRSAGGPETLFQRAPQNVSVNYTIAATFCQPARGQPGASAHNGAVLIATHGLAYDGSYWDPPIDRVKYSFVDYAISQGYSVFFYDRLGTGDSSRVSGYVAQLSNQVAVLAELTKLVRAGKYVGSLGKPSSVVYVGHSFGSTISIQAIANDITAADGLVLTGYTLNSDVLNGQGTAEISALRIASSLNSHRWGQLDSGYVTQVDVFANVGAFFAAPDYDPAVANFAQQTRSPMGIVELITSQVPVHPVGYKGPTLLISGQKDFIMCKSDCDGGVLNVTAVDVFSTAKAFKAVSYPLAGHGINLHLNAVGAFKEITDFLSTNGL
ncbi:Alpha/Beta hydrolase protein [Podospora appendiculata]|uniref:Alpha/Beta hydrolase protein n=1 Tax=Podospora appendiculata TaxID=314037 RepID=A0AAE0X871_9PEZI|nr:Alpha/Beta hydrolase protein [Podospora appendiculata]